MRVSFHVDVGETVELEGDPDKNVFMKAPCKSRSVYLLLSR